MYANIYLCYMFAEKLLCFMLYCFCRATFKQGNCIEITILKNFFLFISYFTGNNELNGEILNIYMKYKFANFYLSVAKEVPHDHTTIAKSYTYYHGETR